MTGPLPQLGIMTVEREEPYLRNTLVDMLAKDPLVKEATIRVVASGEDISYAERIVAGLPDRPAKITVERIDPKLWARAIMGPLGARTVTAGHAVLNGSGPLLYLQDDLLFSKGWLSRTMRTWGRVRELRGTLVALSLYAAAEDFTQGPSGREFGYAEYTSGKFFGSLALLISGELRPLIAAAFSQASHGNWGHDDMVLQGVFCSPPFPSLFVMLPNVVQHVGRSSSLGGRFFESPTFVEKPQCA